ncbi:tRNA 2-selenouridine synthase [Campylobacter concisus]|uniref:tRNA 2-selenouridine synthase n=1 Tax=Campylobacter concisus TaxID=199 RepID=UPI000D3AEE25|nr:tRNA 2-selenouridine synthase [Campylobacter concisus]
MKFIGIILLLLTSIFLIACSANQASNKISNSELENLASKYGGVYVFNEKFEKEITTKEKIRREAELAIVNASKTDAEMRQNLKGFDKKYPRTLSNGKQYYTTTRAYGNDYGKQPKLSNQDRQKIINYIGTENYNKFKPTMLPSYFYVDDNDNVVAIAVSVYYVVGYTKYGLFGDEGRGFSLSRKDIKDIGGDNKIYLEKIKE